MIRTAVGYAGGASPNPTYHAIGGHAEAVQIEYDPSVLTYEALLAMFWRGHDPSYPGRGQYRAAIFCDDDTQRARAEASAADLGPVKTEILVGAPFYDAEDYHQKWYLRRQDDLWSSLARHYENEAALMRSIAAAKANGYVAGYGTSEQLARDLPLMALPADRFAASGR